jgi:hypothetical protein
VRARSVNIEVVLDCWDESRRSQHPHDEAARRGLGLAGDFWQDFERATAGHHDRACKVGNL